MIYFFNSTEVLATERMIPPGTNSSPTGQGLSGSQYNIHDSVPVEVFTSVLNSDPIKKEIDF